MNENKSRPTVNLTPEVHLDLKSYCLELERKGWKGNQGDAVALLLRSAKVEPALVPVQSVPKTGQPSPHADWHDLLERILTHGTERQKLGIQSNLEAFAANLPPKKRRAM